MKYIKYIGLFALIIGALTFSSCKDQADPVPVTHAAINLQFDHVWGMSSTAFDLDVQYVHPKTGDTMTFSKIKYYISNIQLQDESGEWWVQDESYHLIDLQWDGGNVLRIENVPIGKYQALRFTHGVDSVRNFSGAQTGALSVTNNMFWSWNSGYIMCKLEGSSPQAQGNFSYHLGGYTAPNNIVTDKESLFGADRLTVAGDRTETVHIMVNPARAWHSVGTLANMSTTIHMPGDTATMMAKDLFDWTSYSHID